MRPCDERGARRHPVLWRRGGVAVVVDRVARNLARVHPDASDYLTIDEIQQDVDEVAKVEQFPRTEGRMMTMVIAPKKRKN